MSNSSESDDELFQVFDAEASEKRVESPIQISDDNDDEADRRIQLKKRVESFIDDLVTSSAAAKKQCDESAWDVDLTTAEDQDQVVDVQPTEEALCLSRFFEGQSSTLSHLESHESFTHQVAVPPGQTYAAFVESAGAPAITFEYTLDPFQEAAVKCIENNQSVLVSAHTSAGKTAIAYYAIAYSLQQEQRVIYTSPIKALSNQKFREFCDRFPDVGLLTGDVTINPTAACLVMTTEILRSMLYHGSEVIKEIGWVIFDEIHYMRDRERGVVWEEAIILLPDTVRQVFLSATIPNGCQFAEWIAVVHKQICHVISTDRRPVPLQHYIFPVGGDGIYQVYESNSEFNEKRFNQAVQKLSQSSAADSSRRGNPKNKNAEQAGSALFKVVNLIAQTKLTPVIVFCFSRRECEAYAVDICKKIDFNTAHEKKLVEEVFNSAVSLLSEEDRKLAQIMSLLPMLQAGVGIHHSGLLPIMKEVIEILFSEGLIKGLFATETFSMGLNMPAKTVLFASVRKFDGTSHRWITSGEYIQMSGRAGRRGIDSRGLVIMVIDTMMSTDVARDIIMGKPDPLNSQFRLTYNMVLNLLRVEGINPEYMLERSFSQFQNCLNLPTLVEKVKQLQSEHDAMQVPSEQELSTYYSLKEKIKTLNNDMLSVITKPIYLIPFIQPGRLVRLCNGQHDFGWCVVVNFHKKLFKRGAASTSQYVIDVLVPVSRRTTGGNFIDNFVPPEKKEDPVVECIAAVSSVRVYYPRDLRDEKTKMAVLTSVQDVRKKFSESSGGLPLLDPIEDMGIKDESFKKTVEAIEQLEKQVAALSIGKREDFDDMMRLFDGKRALEEKLIAAKSSLEKTKSLMQLDQLQSRKRVLRRLGYSTASDVITLKGRVACEISAGDELLLTEFLFDGKFAQIEPSTCAAILSCAVFQEKGETVELTEELKELILHMQRIAKRIVRVNKEVNVDVDEEEYLATIKPQMMPIVYAWSKGESFDKITSMSTIFEGSISRTMRRLCELLQEMGRAAQAMGNEDLVNKFNLANLSIKRGIIFAPSLYL